MRPGVAITQHYLDHTEAIELREDLVAGEVGGSSGRRWTSELVSSGITEGPVFRPIDRHHRVGPMRLSGEGVCLVIRERVQAAGIDPKNYSGHSLRAGLATSAAQAGVSSWKIRQQTGHASDAMLSRYIRDGELFINNAAGMLL
jgi:integrase